jgi:hypothetical protein
MYARVARWEGEDAAKMRDAAEQLKARAEEGPPEGVPAKGFTLLIDPEAGRTLAISLYETDEDRRKGDETLNAMTPMVDTGGQRASVEMYEVAIDLRI